MLSCLSNSNFESQAQTPRDIYESDTPQKIAIDNKQPATFAKVAETDKMMNEFEIPEVKKLFAEHRDQTNQDTRAVLNEKLVVLHS